MSNFALGWASAETPHAEDLTQETIGSLVLISSPCVAAPTARARMGRQVQLFEAGVDFLPFAPRASYCTSVVRRLTLNQMNELQVRLKKTSGYGQLTVRLTTQRLDMDGGPDVPSWLRSRQILQARRREQEKVLEAAMVEIMRGAEFAAATAPLVRHNQCTCHLLIPRQAQDRFKSLIAKRAAAFSGIVRNLDVTGLWPPYAFSEITAATEQKGAA